MELQEIRFPTLAALSEAFERLCGQAGTELCLARPAALTLQVRTRDPAALGQLGGRAPLLVVRGPFDVA